MSFVRNKVFNSLVCKHKLYLISIALFFSALLIIPSILILNTYYLNHSFYYDPVTGISKGILFYQRMLAENHLNPIISRLNFAILHYQADPKTAFFYIPTILFIPKLLATPIAVVPAVIIICLIYFLVFVNALYKRGQSWRTIFLWTMMTASAPVYWDCFRGITTGWYDLPTGFLLASSLICLTNWLEFNTKKSLYFAFTFVSLTCVARSIFAIYGMITFAPVFLFIFFFKLRNKDIHFKPYIKHLLACLMILFLIAGIYHIIHFENNFFYYTKMSVTGKVTNSFESFIAFLKLSKVIGFTYLICFFLLFFFYSKNARLNMRNLFVALSTLTLLLIFWIGYYKMGSPAYHVMLIILPLLSILFVSLNKIEIHVGHKIFNYTFIFGCVVFIYFSINSIINNLSFATNPTTEATNTKKLNQSIASELIGTDLSIPWSAYFEEDYTRIINCELYFKFGKIQNAPYSCEQVLQDPYIEAEYGNKSISKIIDDKLSKLSSLKFIVIYSNHKQINLHIEKRFRKSRKITHAVLDYIIKNNNWKLKKIFFSTKFGKLSMFTNSEKY